jgi:GWxTD domain-containing protein
MMRWLMAVPAMLLVPGVASSQGREHPLTVHAVRFYQPAGGATTIEGVCEVRLAAVADPAASSVRYRVEVSVRDSTGLELHRSEWAREVPSRVAGAPGASSMETFRFAATPGRYQVSVRAVPERGEPASRTVEVAAFGSRPLLSDLLLATAVRAVDDTATVAPGEVRRGGAAFRTAPAPRLTFADASLSYYVELYPWPGAGAEGRLVAEVIGASGERVVQAVPRQVRVGGRGGASRGTLDLAGLPAGAYRLRLEFFLGDSSARAEAPFTMGAPVAVAALSRPSAEHDMFADASEERLDSLQAPLVYLEDESERGQYGRLTLSGKRNFLREFWRRRDPTPGTPENSAMTQFYAAVAYANEAFREGGAAQIPGWRTDRGRIHLKHGRPDEVLRRPLGVGGSQPYEVWKYTRGRGLYFVFWDQSAFGHYTLIVTSDRTEVGYPDWERRLNREAVDDIARFLRL